MNSEVGAELIRLVPTILWITFVGILVWAFHKPIRQELLPRISSLKAFGVEFAFVREGLDRAVEERAGIKVSEDDRWQVLRRARRIAPVLQGAQVLWVDDNPDGNIAERKLLRSLGIFVDLARDTNEALRMLESSEEYNAVISDMERKHDKNAGRDLVGAMLQRDLYRRTILYVTELNPSRGTPAHVHGITNRPDHLLHYIMDVLERERS